MKFLLLALLFAAPLAAAWMLYFVYPSLRPQGRVNYGQLMDPVRPLPSLRLVNADGALAGDAVRGKWSLVYLAGSACAEPCLQRLVLTRQVRLALHRYQTGLQRVYLAPDAGAAKIAQESLAAGHPDVVFVADAGRLGARALDFFQPRDPGDLFLLDPLGNWVMVYTGDIQPKGLHRDLKKLLKFSP